MYLTAPFILGEFAPIMSPRPVPVGGVNVCLPNVETKISVKGWQDQTFDSKRESMISWIHLQFIRDIKKIDVVSPD